MTSIVQVSKLCTEHVQLLGDGAASPLAFIDMFQSFLGSRVVWWARVDDARPGCGQKGARGTNAAG